MSYVQYLIFKHIHKDVNHVFIFCFSGDIIFNAHYPDLPPDFIFGEDAEFLPDPSALHVSTSVWEPHSIQRYLAFLEWLQQQEFANNAE